MPLEAQASNGQSHLHHIPEAKSSHKDIPESRVRKLVLALDGRNCKVTLQRGQDAGREEGLLPCSQMILPQESILHSSRNKLGAPKEKQSKTKHVLDRIVHPSKDSVAPTVSVPTKCKCKP